MRAWILLVLAVAGCAGHDREPDGKGGPTAEELKIRGDFYYQNAHWDQAHDQFLKAVDLKPDDPEINIALIYTCRMQARVDKELTPFSRRGDHPHLVEALLHSELALERFSSDAQVHFAVALVCEDMNWWDRAEAEIREALKSEPGFPEAYLELSRILFYRSRQEWGREDRKAHDDSILHLRDSASAAEKFLSSFRARHNQPAANEPELKHWIAALRDIADHGGEVTDDARAQLHLADPDFVTAPIVREPLR